MSSKVLYPELSEAGWESSSIRVADNLFSCFFASDYSQTYLYDGLVSSFAWIIQDTQNDITRTITLTQKTLSDYFTRYFNSVVVEVSEVPNTEDPSKQQLSIYLKFTDTENREYVLGKLIRMSDMKVNEIIDISNG